MALKDTIKHMRDLLNQISHDLEKSDASGNKAASQRVRTGTVKLEKVAKTYRKESIKNEKGAKSTKKSSSKKPVAHKKAKPQAKAKTTAVKAKGKAKAHRAHPRALSFKKPSAKLPSKRAFAF